MRRTNVCFFAIWLALSAMLGCTDSADSLREWEPADHVQPPDDQVDPNRVPQREVKDASDKASLLWQGLCASCHGATGRGNGWELPAGIDFTSAAWQQSRPDEDLANQIKHGAPPMPAFGGRLTDAEIASLVEFIRGLGDKPSD